MKEFTEVYELAPCDSRKSFYGKAKVYLTEDGEKWLKSYDTFVLKQDSNGKWIRLWDGWSATTGRHISAFAGFNKKEFMQLPLE